MGFSLESIKTGKENKPPIIVFYGPQGIGKTTWAASSPNPIFIPLEDGIGTLEYARFPKPASFDDVIAYLTVLGTENHDYKTVVLDTASGLEQLIHAEVRAKNGEKIFASYGKGFKLVEPYLDTVTKYLSRLRDVKGMTVIVLGHCNIQRYESPDVEPYDRYTLNCHEKMQTRLYYWSDCMFFANYKVMTTSDDLGFDQKRTRAMGSGERTIFTEERPAFLAKNRYGLPFELPFPKEFYWDKLIGEIEKKLGGPLPAAAKVVEDDVPESFSAGKL